MKKGISLFLLFFILFPVFCQNVPPNASELRKEVDELKDEIIKLKNHISLYDRFYTEQKDMIIEQRNYIDKYNGFILIAIIILGSIGSIGALAGWLYFLNKIIPKIAREKIELIFDKIATGEKERLLKIINRTKYEEIIKLKKKILVLYTGNDSKDLKKLFHAYLFKNVTFSSLSEIKATTNFDLVLFDNHLDNLNTEQANKIIENSNNTIPFLFLTPGRMDSIIKCKYANYSNSLNTLYPRLVELLQYRDYMEGDFQKIMS